MQYVVMLPKHQHSARAVFSTFWETMVNWEKRPGARGLGASGRRRAVADNVDLRVTETIVCLAVVGSSTVVVCKPSDLLAHPIIVKRLAMYSDHHWHYS